MVVVEFGVAVAAVDVVAVDFVADVVGNVSVVVAVVVVAVVVVAFVVVVESFQLCHGLDGEQLHEQRLPLQQHNVEPFSKTSTHYCFQLNCCALHFQIQSSYSSAVVVVVADFVAGVVHSLPLDHCCSVWLMDSSKKVVESILIKKKSRLVKKWQLLCILTNQGVLTGCSQFQIIFFEVLAFFTITMGKKHKKHKKWVYQCLGATLKPWLTPKYWY